MNILLLDVESTGIDTKKDRIIEIGAMLVNEKWEIQACFSKLIKDKDYPPLTADIQRITKISQEMLDKEGLPTAVVAEMLSAFAAVDISFVVAYNKSFDESIFKEEMLRGAYTLFPGIANILNTPWLCAMVDIESNYMYKSWKQSHLALEYNVTVNPSELHRAINDVELMRKILIASGATVESMHKFQQEPWMFVAALIPAPWTDGGIGKNNAVKAGYSWETAKGTDSPRFEKTWVRRIKATKLEVERKSVPFQIKEVKNGTN